MEFEEAEETVLYKQKVMSNFRVGRRKPGPEQSSVKTIFKRHCLDCLLVSLF